MGNLKFLMICVTTITLYGFYVWSQKEIMPYKVQLARAEAVKDAIAAKPSLMTDVDMHAMGGPEYSKAEARKRDRRINGIKPKQIKKEKQDVVQGNDLESDS